MKQCESHSKSELGEARLIMHGDRKAARRPRIKSERQWTNIEALAIGEWLSLK